MAAGLGFKTFNTGEVLTSADVNGYLMQGVLVFASEAARNAAITSPQEGQFAYTKDNNSLWYYTGSAWAASGATGDIEGVTAGTGISGGGTSGTVTITNSMATEIDAKGDLVVGTGADTFARLAVGTNGHTLVADSSVSPQGLKWAVDPVADVITTAGDLIYGTAADTVARLGIGTAGQVLKVNSGATAPEWGAAGGAGALTFTGSASPSASASFTIANCFSATYRNYLVVFDGSLTADTLIRFGTSGTANSTSNYTYRGYYNISSLTALNVNQATSFKTLDHGSVSIGGTIRIQSPFATKRTSYEWDLIGVNGSTTALDANLAGFFDDTTSFTDLNFSTSGTFTGNVYVYGLSNS